MIPLSTIVTQNSGSSNHVADNDAALAQEARAKPQAFATLYQRHVNRVYRYLLARVGNVHDAQDLTSQTFLEAYESIGKFRGSGAFAAWLLRIARNKAADHFRRLKPTSDIETAYGLSDSAESPADQTHHKLQIEKVAHQLSLIAPDRAEAISLRVFGGLDVKEIARLMDKKEPAVRMLIHRGMGDLKTRLRPNREVES